MFIPRLLIAALTTASIVTTANAACEDIPRRLRADGAWLFQDGKTWRPVQDELNDFIGKRSKRIFFTYVVKDKTADGPRRGVLVVKSGYDLAYSQSDGDTRDVKLLRPSQRNVDKCESDIKRFFEGRVNAEVYDRYHDYGFRTRGRDTQVALLDRFHIKYATRITGKCVASNEASTDIYFRGKQTSNRSQFSFDVKRVEEGQYSQLLSWLRITPAYAALPMADRQVEIRKYASDDDGVACVRFDLRVRPGRFIRINDLERRGLFREKEQKWTWKE
ncbi:hypothetical protein [Rhizobium leguminosarum]|uniref:hypothetical protein n=1 Tax=Rhizobium leguminosarum TaxID=384 RepID=UPI00103B49F6|nr:hypothetical protein [Rhizobium leguminosarum]TBZ96276.1 hypothetical protein E0H57_32475 [Rhizobium leguminosarum bv. viciae]